MLALIRKVIARLEHASLTVLTFDVEGRVGGWRSHLRLPDPTPIRFPVKRVEDYKLELSVTDVVDPPKLSDEDAMLMNALGLITRSEARTLIGPPVSGVPCDNPRCRCNVEWPD